MRISKLIVATHRDLGYFFAGLTIIYAISGISVNHVQHWNPNYAVHTEAIEVGDLPSEGSAADLGQMVLDRLKWKLEPTAVIRMAPDELKIFFKGRTLSVSIPDGHVKDEETVSRPLLYEMNYLHLNHGKGVWTWFADFYALGLLILALTGIFIIRGKKGLGGRGLWLLLAGTAIPLLFLILKLG